MGIVPTKSKLLFKSLAGNRSAATRRRAGLQRRPVPKLLFKGSFSYACSRLPDGKFSFMEYARLSDDPDVVAIVHRWDSLSHDD